MNLLGPALEGFLTGIALSLMLGPVFFSILQNSLKHGYKTGVLISFGVIVSDILFISLAIGSATFAVLIENWKIEFSVGGGLALMVFGFVQVLRKPAKDNTVEVIQSRLKRSSLMIANGFFLNVINPVNFFVWLGIASYLTLTFNYTLNHKLVFFLFSLFSIFITESLVAIFASSIRRWMNDNRLKWINRIVGLIFVGLGIYFCIRFI
jgi:threonine/homoserine/homoserine lactone efflux protein